ncbi:MAG TPA: RNA polymerase sigma factor [Thermoanaerobaculia bacterium]|nr:RNA polymerase sigma factor [Thermoanaerobaculia bacterium]
MDAPLPTPDLLLARRAAAGQPQAWDELIERHGGRLFNLALQFSASVEEAEDLTQEIFLRLYQSLRLYRGDCPLLGWALRLSRNLCIDHWRRVRRERLATAVSEEILLQMPATDDPRAQAQARQELRAVHEALTAMPEELAEVVLLRDLQGWSVEETAAYLEVPAGTVKSRLHRARLELAEKVTDRLGGRPETGPAAVLGGAGSC